MYIPDGSYYYAEDCEETECRENWKTCRCDKCIDLRADYADMLYERKMEEALMMKEG